MANRASVGACRLEVPTLSVLIPDWANNGDTVGRLRCGRRGCSDVEARRLALTVGGTVFDLNVVSPALGSLPQSN